MTWTTFGDFILQIIPRRRARQLYRQMASNTSWQQQQGEQQDGGDCIIIDPPVDNVTYPPSSYKNVTTEEAAAKISVSSLVMALALFGNCLVVTTVWRCRRLRTPTNVYIVSLAISDLLITLSCTWVHLVIPVSYLD